MKLEAYAVVYFVSTIVVIHLEKGEEGSDNTGVQAAVFVLLKKQLAYFLPCSF